MHCVTPSHSSQPIIPFTHVVTAGVQQKHLGGILAIRRRGSGLDYAELSAHGESGRRSKHRGICGRPVSLLRRGIQGMERGLGSTSKNNQSRYGEYVCLAATIQLRMPPPADCKAVRGPREAW